jgi:hypothetical protein
METKLTYETKCRHCGCIAQWTYIDVVDASLDQFIRAIEQRVKGLKYSCQHCAMETVHDLMSYGDKDIPENRRRFSLLAD